MNIPNHVAIILDGNGRWAKAKGMPRNYGHVQGAKTVEQICEDAWNLGIHYLTVYAFSTENWKRSPQEVRFLMGFSREIIHRRVEQMDEWGVRVRWSGRRPKLWKSVID